jgi:hypothetical protein
MRCVRVASNVLHIVACVLLTLVVTVSAATPSKASGNLIRVWTVGSPQTGALPPAVVPPELRQRAESLGYTIEVETFRANGFTAKFHEALLYHNEPEILTFSNYSAISGLPIPTSSVEGAASPFALVHETLTSLQPRGWVMLVRSAVNYEAAVALSMRPAECERRVADSLTIEPELRQAVDKAMLATRAYVDCDRSTLSAISDESRLVQQCFLPQSDAKVESVKACSVSGNHKLAFVSLVSAFSAELRKPNSILPLRHGMDLGQESILAVLRSQNGSWRLLAITHDDLNTVARMSLTTANVFVNSLDAGFRTGLTPAPAQLLTPDGVYPLRARNERFGDFTWQPSPSLDVIGQVVEFMWGRDANWGLTRLFFLSATDNKLSSGYLMSGGPSVWRVWSITRAGDVAFSEQHSFRH